MWRFPFTAYENGGGAFLIPYLIVLFFIGRPLYFMELSMGQFASKSSVKVWDMVPGFRGKPMIKNPSTPAFLNHRTGPVLDTQVMKMPEKLLLGTRLVATILAVLGSNPGRLFYTDNQDSTNSRATV